MWLEVTTEYIWNTPKNQKGSEKDVTSRKRCHWNWDIYSVIEQNLLSAYNMLSMFPDT